MSHTLGILVAALCALPLAVLTYVVVSVIAYRRRNRDLNAHATRVANTRL